MSYRRSHKVDQHFELRDELWDTAIFWNHYKKLIYLKLQVGWRSRPGIKGGAPKLPSEDHATKSGAPNKQVPSQCKSARPPNMSKLRWSTQSRKWNWFVIWMKFLYIGIIIGWIWIELKLKLKLSCKVRPSQAGQRWNWSIFEILIVSRAQDPEAWGRVCWIGTVSFGHSQSLQMIHVSCPLETKKQGLTKFFEQWN